jgi:hypothetical protein
MAPAERQRKYRERRAAELAKRVVVLKYLPRPDRRSRAQKWDDAVNDLTNILDAMQKWRAKLLSHDAHASVAVRLDAVLDLRPSVEALRGVVLPKGWGRD